MGQVGWMWATLILTSYFVNWWSLSERYASGLDQWSLYSFNNYASSTSLNAQVVSADMTPKFWCDIEKTVQKNY